MVRATTSFVACLDAGNGWQPAAWVRARQGTAALATALFNTGISIVIVDGEFFNHDHLRDVTAPMDATIGCRFFTLRLAYERALTRVQGDPSRGASKDAVFLKTLHAHFAQAIPFLEGESTVLDTDHLALDQVIAHLLALLGEP